MAYSPLVKYVAGRMSSGLPAHVDEASGYRFYRHDLEMPISIPETGGILPGDDIVTFSKDEGRTWANVEIIPRSYPELLEISGPCIESRYSGDLLAIAALYMMPDGSNPSGQFGVYPTADAAVKELGWKLPWFCESPSRKSAKANPEPSVAVGFEDVQFPAKANAPLAMLVWK